MIMVFDCFVHLFLRNFVRNSEQMEVLVDCDEVEVEVEVELYYKFDNYAV